MGSNKKSNNVSYYVWPLITQSDEILDNQKIDVVLRDSMFQPCKETKMFSLFLSCFP